MEGIEEAFQFYDTKGDSKIAASQIGNCLRSLNLTPTEGLIERMTQQWKDQPEARVSIEEFTPIYKNIKKESGKPPTFEQFQNLLGHFDRDGNGVVMLPDLRYMLQNSGGPDGLPANLGLVVWTWLCQGFFQAKDCQDEKSTPC
ncbi:hypothetical protein Y032_0499g2556 [Ancylostoma ceylanicum]|uniref:EF-hand domain-containing protein n=1 Tax=Ancylostoma ceylanicum TaxID=53326 RepID=A0A016WUF2_9BILA|nr:hypothetical protein Y032_0499g2556 [Ancylostoma ceylanicum]